MKVEKDFLLVLKSSGFGESEPNLGEKLLKSFLNMFGESDRIPARIICINTGIFLTIQGSPVAEAMRILEKRGTEIFTCGTCLEYFDKKDKLIIGKPTNMKDTVKAMLEFTKVITL